MKLQRLCVLLFSLFWTQILVTCFDSCSNYIPERDITDCLPDESSGEPGCRARGCCWRPTQTQGVPWCFYPENYQPADYRLQSTQQMNGEEGFTDKIHKNEANPRWPNDILNLQVQVSYVSPRVARIRITDAANSRFEVPLALNIDGLREKHRQLKRNYQVTSTSSSNEYGLTLTRTSDGSVLFNSSVAGPFIIYTDQFLELSTLLPSRTIFGIGERENNFLRRVDSWSVLGLYSRDTVPRPDANLYGVHNFLLGMIAEGKSTGTSYGYFFLNSHAQEVILQPKPAITYRTIGGILDLFIFTAEHPRDVVSDYWTLIGPPTLPPYWSLGFHLCRWGYYDTNHIRLTMQRNIDQHMPHDVVWADIDYMDRYLDWTVDPQRYHDLGDFVKRIRQDSGKRFVMVVDPGVGSEYAGNYPVYDDGIREGVFINKSDNSAPIVGKVWPGLTVFPDFTNPRTLDWWAKHMKLFYDKVPFSGVWIDMNEPSNFYYGSTEGCGGNKWDDPPYTPHIDFRNINQLTLCASARQTLGRLYDLHSMYGYFEAKVTYEALQKVVPRERPFILSRSTFAGAGRYAAHWTGDNLADWHNLFHSVVQIMNFNLYGIPMTGADVCGFREPTNEELCTRWMQVGSFYPFMRNHNDNRAPDKDPGAWGEDAKRRMRDTLRLRYSLLPYLYTQMHRATTHQLTVFHPLFFFYPNDTEIYGLDTQFMLGPALMVAPIFGPGAAQRDVFLPEDAWCNLHELDFHLYKRKWHKIPITMDNIPVYIRGGQVVSFQGYKHNAPESALTTDAYRQLPFTFIACMSMTGEASGEMVVDDGITMDSVDPNLKKYNLIHYYVNTKESYAKFTAPYRGLMSSEDKQSATVPMEELIVLGIPWRPKGVSVTYKKAKQIIRPPTAADFEIEENVLKIKLGGLDFVKADIDEILVRWM
jgi:lysosomal alpha-glucosidase